MKILIAEDDFVCRILLQEILNEYGTCHMASNGQEAIDAYLSMLDKGEPYDVIFLDIMMPEKDGQQVLRKIREIEQERKIGGNDMTKIVMCTALDDSKNIMTALIKGSCEGYLNKPIDTDKVIELVEKMGFNKTN